MSDPQADQTCFVISPIGLEGTEIRRHADDVFDLIISPALERCGLTPVRSDHIGEPGRISDQMFRHLLQDRMCIAVLADVNPSVMYEIALAQVAARPLVLLAPKGLMAPFDIKDFRWVEMTRTPRSSAQAVSCRTKSDSLSSRASSSQCFPIRATKTSHELTASSITSFRLAPQRCCRCP